MATVEGKRIFLKRKLPNPVFQGWLEELHEEAKAKRSKLEPMLCEALTSLSKYPLVLKSGAECAILKGFDRRLCSFLDQRLEIYSNQHDPETSSSDNENLEDNSCIPPNSGLKLLKSNSFKDPVETAPIVTENATKNSFTATNIVSESLNASAASSSTSKVYKGYKPAFRSGGYAILLALLEHSQDNICNMSLKKDDLIAKAQKYSEESFTRPKPGSFYTAWSSMRTLINKQLVHQVKSKKSTYTLTDLGMTLAIYLLEDSKNKPTANDIIFNGAPSSSCSGKTEVSSINSQDLNEENICMTASSFEVLLLIDKNETGGVSKKSDPTVAQFNKYPDLKHEYRSLKVGDYTWIARHKVNNDQELVLPYVVERKRMDDLGASIKDGRFHEQKFRLRKCGLENVIYLIENYDPNQKVGLPVQSLKQALANTRVQDSFKVHITNSLTDSVKFLAMMTKRLTLEFKDKTLTGCNSESNNGKLMTFKFFSKSTFKNKPLTVTEMFIKLLLQLKGVSVEKAIAITAVYRTPKSLLEEYEKCSQKEGEMLLSKFKYGDLNRNVGPSVSKAIYNLLK